MAHIYNTEFFDELIKRTTTERTFKLTGMWEPEYFEKSRIFDILNTNAQHWFSKSLPEREISSLTREFKDNENWLTLNEKVLVIANDKASSLADLVGDFGLDSTKIELSFLHNNSSDSSSGNFSGNSSSSLETLGEDTTVLEALTTTSNLETLEEEASTLKGWQSNTELAKDDEENKVASDAKIEEPTESGEESVITIHRSPLNREQKSLADYLVKMRMVNLEHMDRCIKTVGVMKAEIDNTIVNLPKIIRNDDTVLETPKLEGSLDISLNRVQTSILILDKMLSNLDRIHEIHDEIYKTLTKELPNEFNDQFKLIKKPAKPTLGNRAWVPQNPSVLEKIVYTHGTVEHCVEELEDKVGELQETFLFIYGRIKVEIDGKSQI